MQVGLRGLGVAAVAVAVVPFLVPATAQASTVAFVSPTASSLTGTVDLEVTAPPDTTSVRFSVDGTAVAEVTNQYATATGSAPIWRTATDAGWFAAGAHTLRADAITPSGTVTATKAVTTTRPADAPGSTSLDGTWAFATEAELADTEAQPRPLWPAPGGVLALDAGGDTSPLAPGYQRLGTSTGYSTATGFGWVGTAPQQRDRANPDDLRRDFATDTAARTLRITVPSGGRTLHVLVGDRQYAADPMRISVGGTAVLDTAALPKGSFRWFAVALSGGTHDLVISATTAGTYWKLAALVVS